MKNRRNYYRILHVQPDAHEAVIKASYRTMMHKLKQHPDLGGDHWNATVLNEAYQVLTNAEKRAAYDDELMSQRTTESVGQQHAGGRGGSTEVPEQPKAEEPETNSAPKPKQHRAYTSEKCCGFCGAPALRTAYGDNTSVCTRCQSPLTPVEKMPVDGEDRRTIERIQLAGSVRFYTTWPQESPHTAQTKDLSLHGIQLTSATPVEPGNIIKIGCNALTATGIVRNCVVIMNGNSREFLLGVEFRTLSFRSRSGTFVSGMA